MLARMWRNWKFCTLKVGIWNGVAALENSLAVSQKVKYRITIWPSNSTTRHIPQRIENRYSDKNLFTYVHSSTIDSCQKVKRTPKSICWWMDKQIYTCSEILFGHKKEWSTDTRYSMDEPQKHAKWMNPVTKSHILYDSIYMKYPEYR